MGNVSKVWVWGQLSCLARRDDKPGSYDGSFSYGLGGSTIWQAQCTYISLSYAASIWLIPQGTHAIPICIAGHVPCTTRWSLLHIMVTHHRCHHTLDNMVGHMCLAHIACQHKGKVLRSSLPQRVDPLCRPIHTAQGWTCPVIALRSQVVVLVQGTPWITQLRDVEFSPRQLR